MRVYRSVDLGRTKIAGVAATADQEVVARQTIPTRAYEGPDAVLERIAALINGLARESGEELEAVGVGLPGLLDLEEDVVKFLPNLYAHWRGGAVRDLLSARIGCPVYALNDARMATLGELAYGRGQGVETMAFFTLDTGIGDVVVSGDLHLGKLGAAGELGHQTILPNGPRCGCGNRRDRDAAIREGTRGCRTAGRHVSDGWRADRALAAGRPGRRVGWHSAGRQRRLSDSPRRRLDVMG